MKNNRIFSIMLSLILVLGIMPGMSLTAYADDAAVWNENQVFDDNAA